jgi:uncharacterized protein YbbK (DUF523 family)
LNKFYSKNIVIIVSACLAGIECKYDLTSAKDDKVVRLVAQGAAIPVCPEQLGGLTTPRPPAEIVGGSGEDVLSGKAKVITQDGKDVTQNFIKGAKEVLKIAKLVNATHAILKSKSPSCSIGKIYDGSFKGKLISGDGVCTSLLLQNGIKIKCI